MLPEEVQRICNGEMKRRKDLGKIIGSLKSLKTYIFASEYGKGKYVLDCGCGPGYGSAIISVRAHKVIGVDIAQHSLDFAKKTFKYPNLEFKRIKPFPLPFEDLTFDVVMASHIIEHIPKARIYLQEIRRILKDNGVLIIATPNRKFRLLPFQRPFHLDHIKEYSSRSLSKELSHVFKNIIIKGIYGTKEINNLERKRMKKMRNPFIAYIDNPLMSILRRISPKIIMQYLENLKNIFFKRARNSIVVPNVRNDIETKFTIEDIFIGDDLKKSMDFIAVCKKL